MDQRRDFIRAFESGLYSMTELAERFHVSRKTAYKWRNRFVQGEGLCDRSRAPMSCPHRTDAAVAERIIALRRRHPDWGARTILAVLRREEPLPALPSHTAAHEILRRAGLVRERRPRRRKPQHPGAPPITAEAPNDVWTADYKGEFLLGNREYCYPLTVLDHHARFLLAVRGFHRIDGHHTRRSFERLFAAYGLPRVIRTDNGVPFAAPNAIHGLSTLSVYFLKLGIRVDRIEPGKPQQNGAHERMHRTLKAATARPPARTHKAQQRQFDHFRREYNEIRPHQALDYDTPATRYKASSRAMPRRTPEPKYPPHAEVRLVSSAGTIRFKSRAIFLSATLALDPVALEEVDDGIWNVCFYNFLLGRLDERSFTFIP